MLRHDERRTDQVSALVSDRISLYTQNNTGSLHSMHHCCLCLSVQILKWLFTFHLVNLQIHTVDISLGDLPREGRSVA